MHSATAYRHGSPAENRPGGRCRCVQCTMKFADALAADGSALAGDALYAARAQHLLLWEDSDQRTVWSAALPELEFFLDANGVY